MALQQSPELRALFLRLYQAMETGDVSVALDMISREEGVLGIGTDPYEWWTSFTAIERAYHAQLPEMRAAGVRFHPGEPLCYQEGSVGWCADNARLSVGEGSPQPVRLTAVFHKEGDRWKMVQLHASIGIPNMEALGTDLTI